MTLTGDMLYHYLNKGCGGAIAATRVQPVMHRYLSRFPLFGLKSSWNADRLINRLVCYPCYLGRARRWAEVFHLVDHSYSHLMHYLPPARTVVTCHDLDTFRCLIEPERDPRPFWFQAMTRHILNGFRRAAHVVAVSNATRDELLQHALIPPGRISVIPNGIHRDFSPAPDPGADVEAARLLPSESEHPILLLSVGSTIPRKRIDILLRVFAAVRRRLPKGKLLRVGGTLTASQQGLAHDLGLDGAILTLPFLDQKVLAAVYRRATLLLQPSESEGFGLPPIEAMACGCPAVLSDLPVLREVCGEAGIFCPVADVEIWADTVIRVLRERQELCANWDARRQSGLAHAARYNWTENVQRTAEIYRKLVSADSGRTHRGVS